MELYEKPFKTFEEQADLLLSRGLVAEKNNLIDALKRIGYYRLTGYLHIFKNENETYRNDISLEYIYYIYRFDRKLRLLVYDAIERFEVYLRTNLVYKLSKTQGPFGYLQKDNLPDITQRNYEIFIDKCKTNFNRSKEEFAEHFKENILTIMKMKNLNYFRHIECLQMFLTLEIYLLFIELLTSKQDAR